MRKLNNITKQLVILMTMLVTILPVEAQNNEQSKPVVVYGQNRKVEIGGITVDGVQNYDDNILIGLSGLTIGETISFPGDEITDAVKRYWKHRRKQSISEDYSRHSPPSIASQRMGSKEKRAERPHGKDGIGKGKSANPKHGGQSKDCHQTLF